MPDGGSDHRRHVAAAVFGSAAHATIGRPEQLSGVIGPLFRSALRARGGPATE